MPSWKGKTRGGTSGYKIFIFILQHFGIKPAYFLLRFVVLYFFFFSPKERNAIYDYFRNIHKYSVLKSLSSVLKNYYKLGEILLDKIALLAGFSNTFTFDFQGEEYLREIVAEGRGGLLISAHIGNWEIAGQLLERLETRVNIVMLEAEHERIKHLLDEVLVEKNLNIIPILDDYSHLIKISEALQNNELVAIHGDRYMPGSKKMVADFLGKPAYFPTGPFYLANKFNKPVIFVAAMKETQTHYHFYASKPKRYPRSGSMEGRNKQLRGMIDDYVKNLEVIVNKYPVQWFNYYYFWSLD